jgi:hypothetical protein
LFYQHRERLSNIIYTLWNIFKSERIEKSIKESVEDFWEKLVGTKQEDCINFLQSYEQLIPTKALSYIKKLIRDKNPVSFSEQDIRDIKIEDNQLTSDKILDLIGIFADHESVDTAIDLFLEYLMKRPDKLSRCPAFIERRFSMNQRTVFCGYQTQLLLVDKAIGKSDNNGSLFNRLFVIVANKYLKLVFQFIAAGRKRTINFGRISLSDMPNIRKLRERIWERLLTLSGDQRNKADINRLLEAYGTGVIGEADENIVIFDWPYLSRLLKTIYSPDSIDGVQKVQSICERINRIASIDLNDVDEFYSGKYGEWYSKFTGSDLRSVANLRERDHLRNDGIKEIASRSSLSDAKFIIDMMKELADETDEYYILQHGLEIFFDTIVTRQDILFDVVAYYIEKDTPLDVSPHNIITHLFKYYATQRIYLLLDDEYRQRNTWMFRFYELLPEDEIKKHHITAFYDLIDEEDRTSLKTGYRDLRFLKKYERFDSQIFIKSIRIVATKYESSPRLFRVYCEPLFLSKNDEDNIEEIIELFASDVELLAKIYTLLYKEKTNMDIDRKGAYFKILVGISEKFLELYIVSDCSRDAMAYTGDSKNNITFIFETDDYINLADKTVGFYMKHKSKDSYRPRTLVFKKLLSPHKATSSIISHQKDWIRHIIDGNSEDEAVMYDLFSVIIELKLFDRDDLILYYLSRNKDFDAFKNIPLTPSTWVGCGNIFSHEIKARIQFLESLSGKLSGVEFLEHKKYIEEEIKRHKQRRDEEKVKEFIGIL